MGNFKGLATLKTPRDLLQKLAFDLNRLEGADKFKYKMYAAFDFFVTAEHILDWMYPNDPVVRKKLRENEVLLEITSHIASGVKHFEATAKHHTSVHDVVDDGFVEEGFVEEGFIERLLIVRLAGTAMTYFNDDTIEAGALAKHVYEYWKLKLLNE